MLADVLDLHPPVEVAFPRRAAGLPVRGAHPEPLRPCVQGHYVEFPASPFDGEPSAPVRDYAVRSLAGEARHRLYRVFRRHDLGITVPAAAEGDIFVPIALSKVLPQPEEVLVRIVRKGIGRTGDIIGLAFAPDADVGILLPDPFHESRIVFPLARPHSVLDVPVEKPQGSGSPPFRAGAKGLSTLLRTGAAAKSQQEGGKKN